MSWRSRNEKRIRRHMAKYGSAWVPVSFYRVARKVRVAKIFKDVKPIEDDHQVTFHSFFGVSFMEGQ